jgi:hypothetical protein
MVALAGVVAPTTLKAQCVAPREEGQWINLDPKSGDFYRLDIRMLNCPDTGGDASIHYNMRAWEKQSSGQLYGRPAVKASYNRQQWIYGEVPVGGYVARIWAQAVDRNGVRRLHVMVTYKSLDIKPSATYEYWYRK